MYLPYKLPNSLSKRTVLDFYSCCCLAQSKTAQKTNK